MSSLKQLYTDWVKAKEAEAEAVERRRMIEDQITELMDVDPAQDGCKTIEADGHKVKITTRVTRSVDPSELQSVATELDVPTPIWQGIVRWKAEVDTKNWKALPDDLQAKLSSAVTTKHGRPSYSITAI